MSMPVVVLVVDMQHYRQTSALSAKLFPDILVQCATRGHVEDLGTPTDAEIGDVAVEAELGKAELDGVLLTVDGRVTDVQAAYLIEFLRGEAGGAVGLIEGGVDVFALAEKDTMDGLEAVEELVDASHTRNDHWDGTVGDDEV